MHRRSLHPNRIYPAINGLDLRQDTEHRYAYDFETIENVLREAGFGEVNQSEFDPALDAKSRELGTLYVNARKPPAAV